MHVLVQANDTNVLNVDPTDTIHDLKFKIEDQCTIHIDQPKLLYHSKQLENNKTLNDNNIDSSITIKVVKNGKILLVECNPTNTLRQVLKEFDFEYSQIFVIHRHFNCETTLSNSQIQTTPIYKIPRLFEEKMIIVSDNRSTAPITHESQFIADLSMYFNISDKQHQICSDIEFDAVTNILSIIKKRQPNDPLLLKSTECILNFTSFKNFCNVSGLKSIITLLIDVLSENNNFSDEICKNLLRSVVNLLYATKKFSPVDRDNVLSSNINMLHKLRKLVDPCRDRDIVMLMADAFKLLCSCPGILHENDVSIIQSLLCTLMYYEDDINVIKRAVTGFNSWIMSSKSKKAVDAIVCDPYSVGIKIQLLYKQKQHINRLLFNGYIKHCLIQSETKFLPTDAASIVFDYYNCYNNIKMDLPQRLICLFDKQNCYEKCIRDAATTCFKRITQFGGKPVLNSLISSSKYNVLPQLNELLMASSDELNIVQVYHILYDVSHSDFGYLLSLNMVQSMIDRWHYEMLIGTHCLFATDLVLPLFRTIEKVIFQDRFSYDKITAIIEQHKIIKCIFNFLTRTVKWIFTENVSKAMHKLFDFMESLLVDENFTDICKEQTVKCGGRNILREISTYYGDNTLVQRASVLLKRYFRPNDLNEEVNMLYMEFCNLKESDAFQEKTHVDNFKKFTISDEFTFTGGDIC